MTAFYHDSIPNTSGIYKITCTITNKFYIGSAINLRQRRKSHYGDLQRNTHGNARLQHAWNKYGSESFTFEIVEFVLFREHLLEREQYWLDTLHPFFNIVPRAGSHLGMKRSPETCKRIGDSNRGKPSPNIGKKHTPERIENIRQSLIGYKHTEEAKRNMGNSHKGAKHSLETRERMHIAALGHVVSPETGAKIGASNTGRVVSDETRARNSAASAGRQYAPEQYASRRRGVLAIAPDGTEYIVHGIDKFCKEHGLDGSAFTKVAKGKTSNHKGWKVSYLDSDIT